MIKSWRSTTVFLFSSSQLFNALTPPRPRISDAWMATEGRRWYSNVSFSREAIVKVVAMLLPTMSVIASRNNRKILRKRLCMRPGEGVARAAHVLDFRILAGLEFELAR